MERFGLASCRVLNNPHSPRRRRGADEGAAGDAQAGRLSGERRPAGVADRRRVAAVLLAGACIAAGCHLRSADEWLVKINDKAIPFSAYQTHFRIVKRDLGDIPVLNPRAMRSLKQRILDELIDEELLLQAAANRGVTVSDADIDHERDLLRHGMSERDWRRFVLDHYVDEREWNDSLRRRLTIATLVEVAAAASPISDADVTAYYEEHKPQFERPREIHLYQIVVQTEPQAAKLADQLNGGADFAALAKANSLGPERDRGGDLGYVREADLPASFAPAFALKSGAKSAIVHTEYGYHIFRVTDVRPAQTVGLADARGEIERIVRDEHRTDVRRSLIAQLRQAAHIEINQDLWNSELGAL